MGLAAAYHACKKHHTVDILEAAPEVGGMAAHFDFDGLSMNALPFRMQERPTYLRPDG
jgi:protoporphyrinogen oxidase